MSNTTPDRRLYALRRADGASRAEAALTSGHADPCVYRELHRVGVLLDRERDVQVLIAEARCSKEGRDE